MVAGIGRKVQVLHANSNLVARADPEAR